MRQARAVAAGALVQPRGRNLVLGAPLVASRPRLSLLGDRHAASDGSREGQGAEPPVTPPASAPSTSPFEGRRPVSGGAPRGRRRSATPRRLSRDPRSR